MSKDEFATELTIFLDENEGVIERKQLILSFLNTRAEWIIMNPIEDDC